MNSIIVAAYPYSGKTEYVNSSFNSVVNNNTLCTEVDVRKYFTPDNLNWVGPYVDELVSNLGKFTIILSACHIGILSEFAKRGLRYALMVPAHQPTKQPVLRDFHKQQWLGRGYAIDGADGAKLVSKTWPLYTNINVLKQFKSVLTYFLLEDELVIDAAYRVVNLLTTRPDTYATNWQR